VAGIPACSSGKRYVGTKRVAPEAEHYHGLDLTGDSSDRPSPSSDAFEALFKQNPIPMWILKAGSLGFLAVNEAACLLYGYTEKELLQQNALDMWHEDERDGALRAIRDFGGVFCPDTSATHLKSNGVRIRVLTFAQRISYDDKNCIVLWNVDVTQREKASIELRSTQIFLDAIVESIPSMVFVKDAHDGRFVLLNRAGEELLGLSRGELIGKTDFDLFDPEDARRFRQADQAVVASGKLVTIDDEPLTTPEGVRSLRTQKVGVPDADGRPRYLLGISEDVTEKRRVEARSLHLARHDVLTDLPNRLTFQDVLEQQLGEEVSDFVLLLLDLDRFKGVNDSLGHHVGDELLRQVATRMLALKKEADIVARIGGDEFGVLHRGAGDSGSKLAHALVTVLSQPFFIEGHVVTIGCSAGLALRSRHGGSPDALMKRADLALYSAKTAGKGDYTWFEFAMEEKADRQRILRTELSTALEKQQLHLEYQPIVSSRSGEIVCCEALLRWRHPDRGMISPVEFIPVAEASGLIDPIGKWVLRQACYEAAKWPSHVRVAVNLSARQFTGFGLAADVTEAIAQTGLAPNRLELEITESIFLTDSQENVRILNELKQLGIGIALDDFGTGYSSLAYLRRFSFDKLKIDRSFISDLTSSQESLAIVRAVIGLGKSFGATVTAEGVETAQQYACLAEEGCDQVQGYLLGRPMTKDAIAAKLTDFRHPEAIR
jgi:diguanylate cyclase (GGDEF)-like protein/PAS domain S-box-containing protein